MTSDRGAPSSNADTSNTIDFSLVVPVYRNAPSIDDLFNRVAELSARLHHKFEVVLVIDGSPDNSRAVIDAQLESQHINAQVIEHSRNFGSFAAIKTGMHAARGSVIGVMAADLQEPIELVEEFFAHLSTGEFDVAVGTRVSREDPGASRAMSSTYWRAYRRFIQPAMPVGGVDVFACTRQVAQDLLKLDESNSSLVGLLYWLGYRRIEIPYHRAAREHGKSAWSFRKKLAYMFDSIFSFTSIPISVMLTVGVIGFFASIVYAMITTAFWLAGGIEVPGFTALMIVILLSTSAILAGLGIVGTYVWRAFENTKRRPYAVVMEKKVVSR